MRCTRDKRLKPVILVFIRYYTPGYKSGGPVRSISNLVSTLGDDYLFRVVCLNRDHNEVEEYQEIECGKWTEVDQAMVFYTRQKKASYSLCKRLISEINPDLIYLNSLFDLRFSILPLLASRRGAKVPIVLAPRGELSEGALGLKQIRKRMYIGVSLLTRSYKRVFWHASGASEAERIVKVFKPSAERIFEASNLPSKISSDIRYATKQRGELRVVLVGRIARMKNILTAIRMIRRLSGNVSLDLWGALEDMEYWKICQAEILASQSDANISYKGTVGHYELQRVLGSYHVMLLPTLGENFGHAIVEALTTGLPVVVSDRTPWRNLKDAGVGADISLSKEAEFVSELSRYQEMSGSELQAVREVCKSYSEDWSKRQGAEKAYKKLFAMALG